MNRKPLGLLPPALAASLAASPARYMVERADWKGAAELPVRPTQFAHVQAMTHFARALGAARSGNPDAAKADIAKLAELRDKQSQRVVHRWTIPPPARALAPRTSASFNSAEVDVPTGGDELTVTLGG